KEEYEETEDQSVFTVKSGIMTFLKDTDLKKPFLEALEDVIKRASLLRYLAAQFLYFVVLKHLEAGSEIPNIMNNTGGLMRQCFVSMSTGQSQYVKKNIEIKARHDHINTLASEFKQLNSIEDSSLPDFKELSHVLAQCVKEYDTNCKTHVSVNLFKVLKRWTAYQLEQIFPAVFKSNSRANTVANFIIRSVQFEQKVVWKKQPGIPGTLFKFLEKNKIKCGKF
ncbi:hypothetical protein MP638_004815, partial [Amoeboaphelidium occidentale]